MSNERDFVHAPPIEALFAGRERRGRQLPAALLNRGQSLSALHEQVVNLVHEVKERGRTRLHLVGAKVDVLHAPDDAAKLGSAAPEDVDGRVAPSGKR